MQIIALIVKSGQFHRISRKNDKERNWVCAVEFAPFRKHASSM